MRKFRKLVAAILFAIATVAGTIAYNTQPAGATLWYLNWDWYAGLIQSNFYTANYTGGYCTSGPHYYSWANNHYYQVMPRHCTEASAFSGCGTGHFMSKYVQSNDNKYDCGQIGYTTHPSWGSADVVIADIGTQSAPTPTNGVYNYCSVLQTWKCTSFHGFGSLPNTPYNGMWNWIIGNSWASSGIYVCKMGAHSGTSCGNVDPGPAWSLAAGYTTRIWTVSNLNNCGTAAGDSGSPIVTTDYTNAAVNHSAVGLAGMMINGTNQTTAGSGNGCYSQGTPLGFKIAFISDPDIREAFHLYNLQAVSW